MVEQQIRTWEVLDDKVLDLYYELPRDEFVPSNYKSLAFADTSIPIGQQQFMLEPKVEARMLQAAKPQSEEQVLHIGTGSGYFAALLSKLCEQLTSIDINQDLLDTARTNLSCQGINDINLICADLYRDEFTKTKFDLVIVTGSVKIVPSIIYTYLKSEARLIIPVGSKPYCTVQRIQNFNGNKVTDSLFDTWIPPLINKDSKTEFDF